MIIHLPYYSLRNIHAKEIEAKIKKVSEIDVVKVTPFSIEAYKKEQDKKLDAQLEKQAKQQHKKQKRNKYKIKK